MRMHNKCKKYNAERKKKDFMDYFFVDCGDYVFVVLVFVQYFFF